MMVCVCVFITHWLFDHICPFRWDSVLWVLLKEPAQILQRRSKGPTNLRRKMESDMNQTIAHIRTELQDGRLLLKWWFWYWRVIYIKDYNITIYNIILKSKPKHKHTLRAFLLLIIWTLSSPVRLLTSILLGFLQRCLFCFGRPSWKWNCICILFTPWEWNEIPMLVAGCCRIFYTQPPY